MNRRLKHTSIRAGALGLIGLSLMLQSGAPALAQASYAEIEGTGSTWSATVVQQWITDVNSSGMNVVFTANGSSMGRTDFANGKTDFGISEIPYQGVDPVSHQADQSSRPYAYLPIVAGGTSFTYQLKVAGKPVTNLRLSGQTIAKIFTNKITNWNDPEIAKENGGTAFPSLPINPVVRSDGSGTTAQFTRWLSAQYSSIWGPYGGGMTSQFPRQGRQIAASGSDQVMNTISSASGNGDIGYVEYAYPLNAHYPVVYVENPAGYYVQPTQYNVAVALQQAKINMTPGLNYLTQILDGVYNDTDPRAYPISSYSYMIIPTSSTDSRMTPSKRQTLADFLSYSLCSGQTKAGPYGYSPLPLNLVQAAFGQVERLGPKADGGAVAGVSIKNPSSNLASCGNPTFTAGNLSANHLAQVAPMPLACQKATAVPCGASVVAPGTSAGNGSSAPASGATGGAGGAPTGTTGVPVAGGVPGVGAGGSGASGAGGTVSGNVVNVSSQRSADSTLFGGTAVAELAAIVLIPGLYAAWLRRRKGSA